MIPWPERVKIMLETPLLDEHRLKFVRSVGEQMTKYNQDKPTTNQIHLMERFWKSHEKRRIINILGFDPDEGWQDVPTP